MSKIKQIVGLVSLTIVLLLACAPKTTPAPVSQPLSAPAPAIPAPQAPAAPVPQAAARPAWQEEWERTLDAARREGKVAILYTGGGSEMRTALTKIAKMQGIEVEVFSMRAAEASAKVFAERRAGLYLNDLFFGGPGALIPGVKAAGVLESLDSLLVLPHLTDPQVIKKVWYQGTLPWTDRDHTVFTVALQPGFAMAVNTNLVKSGEIKSWRDLLDPKWTEKLAFNDPTTPGPGPMSVLAMVNIMGEDYVRELAKAKPILIRDQRQQVEWLAHGKVAVAIAPLLEIVVEFVRVGSPISPVVPQEGTWLSAGNGGIAWYKNSPHPNATKVFFNWLTSKEGQEIFAPAGGWHSTREDVPTTHLRIIPGLARQEGVKYYPAYTEESYLNRPVTDKLAKELFGPLVK